MSSGTRATRKSIRAMFSPPCQERGYSSSRLPSLSTVLVIQEREGRNCRERGQENGEKQPSRQDNPGGSIVPGNPERSGYLQVGQQGTVWMTSFSTVRATMRQAVYFS